LADECKRRFLVLGRVGDKSLHKTWIADKSCERTWDLQLNAYGKDNAPFQDGDLPTIFDYGTKFDSLVRHFKADPGLLDRYDYILIPDDDVIMEARDINRFFEIVVEHDLTVAQPAMAMESYFSHHMLLQCPQFKLRYSNFVESMAFCMKTSHFKRILPIWEIFKTGWGSDHIWALLMDDPGFHAAIVDECKMIHTRPLYSGPLYKQLNAGRTDPNKELAMVKACFESIPPMLVYGGILKDGRRVSGTDARLRSAAYIASHAFQMKRPVKALRSSLGLVYRSVTMAGHHPRKLTPLPGSPLEHILEPSEQ
jgi:hypothetical protein